MSVSRKNEMSKTQNLEIFKEVLETFQGEKIVRAIVREILIRMR